MFSLNGIVYASEKTENIQVVSVKPLDDMKMILTFSMDYFWRSNLYWHRERIYQK